MAFQIDVQLENKAIDKRQVTYHTSKPTQLFFLALLPSISLIFISVEEVNKYLVSQYCQLLTILCRLDVVLMQNCKSDMNDASHQAVIVL